MKNSGSGMFFVVKTFLALLYIIPKTNLLLPLWKLNPARDGEIQPTSDFPKTMFGDIRADAGNYPFVTAEFETNDGTERRQIAQAAGGIMAAPAGRAWRIISLLDALQYIVEIPPKQWLQK